MSNQMGVPAPQTGGRNNTVIIAVVVVLVLCCCCLAVALPVGWFCGDWIMGTANACTF
jgi:hypothetical protein